MKYLKLAALAIGTALLPSASSAAPILYNSHYYEFVGGSFTWGQALANAAAATPINGYVAHLATITSAGELDFVGGSFGGKRLWSAGSDADQEGVWKWMAGPELGQIFFGPGAPVGSYSKWTGGIPANVSGLEDYLVVNASGVGISNWAADPSNANLGGYIVEWSVAPSIPGVPGTPAVPEPATWAMMIGGFGFVGAMVRRRKMSVRFA